MSVTSGWASLRSAVGAAAQGDVGPLTQPPPDGDSELAVRWDFARCLLPFPDTQPMTTVGENVAVLLAHHRMAAKLRMRLLPYLRTCQWLQREHQWPALGAVLGSPSALMIGASLVAAPVTVANATACEITLPPGGWYDFWNDAAIAGGIPVRAQAARERLPLYVRAGATLLLRGFDPERPQTVLRAYMGEGESALYEDGGLDDDYIEGNYRWVYVTVSVSDGMLRLTRRTAGSFTPASPLGLLQIVGLPTRPKSVHVDRRNAPVWYWEHGRVELCLPDDFSEVEVRLS